MPDTEADVRQLTVRGIDDAVYGRLKALARLNHRSVEAQVRAILERATCPDRSEIAGRAAAMRARLAATYTGDATAEIRADRDR